MNVERYYTTVEVAALVNAHPETIRRRAARGELPSLRIGRDRRYPESAVKAWLESLREKERAA